MDHWIEPKQLLGNEEDQQSKHKELAHTFLVAGTDYGRLPYDSF
jgi:hypothetical protein